MKKQYQLREGEALHEWIDRLMESLPLRRLSDSDLRDVLREVSIKSYIRGSRHLARSSPTIRRNRKPHVLLSPK